MDQKFNGKLEFKVPVKVDRSISKTIDINYTDNNGVSLNSIIISSTKTIVTTANINHNPSIRGYTPLLIYIYNLCAECNRYFNEFVFLIFSLEIFCNHESYFIY